MFKRKALCWQFSYKYISYVSTVEILMHTIIFKIHFFFCCQELTSGKKFDIIFSGNCFFLSGLFLCNSPVSKLDNLYYVKCTLLGLSNSAYR